MRTGYTQLYTTERLCMTNPEPQATPSEGPKFRPLRWLLGLPVLFFIVLMLVSKLLFTASPDRETQWVERETIRQCWKELKRKPDDDKPRHFTGQAQCEQLEQDFRQRWNDEP